MGNRTLSWAVLVGEALHQRIRLSEVVPGLFPLEYLPEVHATADDIADAERRLGHPLDAQHAAVLSRISGWRNGLPDGGALPEGALLSTGDLGQGTRWRRIHEILAEDYALDRECRTPDSHAPALPDPGAMYPFMYTEFNNNPHVAVVERVPSPDPDDGAPVHLIGEGTLLETWPTFYDFWTSQIAMLRRSADEYEQQRDAGTLPGHLATP